MPQLSSFTCVLQSVTCVMGIIHLGSVWTGLVPWMALVYGKHLEGQGPCSLKEATAKPEVSGDKTPQYYTYPAV
jgi:hypothetical protein